MDSYSPQFLTKASTGSSKFDLFLKTHELKEVGSVLEKVILMPKGQRSAWVEENGELIREAVEVFVRDSNLTLEEVTMDTETMELSKELVVSLRDTMNIVQGILFDQPHMVS
ncbi:MAG: hypothetical protein COY81_03475 [Candidatus Pacebacteria bacterium CG_4_10_14_0_8_um_filter_43_12]|nr:MAG: hypothetical protein COY81_03475 [Candidatus Pacebacteria bacterium CG_4_10_14_0_8_um_filter_43_12]